MKRELVARYGLLNVSLPARGAWVETFPFGVIQLYTMVAPRKGSVG